MVVEYRGTDRRGAGVTGRIAVTDLAVWVQRRWKQGWRHLTVTCAGIEVAGIARDAQPAMWWSE